MKFTPKRLGVVLIAGALAMPIGAADAASINWHKYSGQTINVLADNNPVGELLQKHEKEFHKLTGINVNVSLYSEQQFRQRLQTIMQSKSDQVDVYMSLVSRDGKLYSDAGWYQNLKPFVTSKKLTSSKYDFSDFPKALIKAREFNGTLTGIPVNIEGPVLYYRRDIFKKCDVSKPSSLNQLEAVAEKISKCDTNVTAFASRGLPPAVPYTFSNFLHNFGGTYLDSHNKSNLKSKEGANAIMFYSNLLAKYGPPGVVNYSFPQLSPLFRNGQSAMSFESSNEYSHIMNSAKRRKDTSIMLLPPGPSGSHPVAIGWELSMSPFSKHKDAAWYFIQWATTKKMEGTFGVAGLAPPRKSPWSSGQFSHWVKQKRIRREWAAALKKLSATGSAVLAPNIVLQPEARQDIGEAIDDVILGKKTAQQSARDVDQKIDQLIAQSQ